MNETDKLIEEQLKTLPPSLQQEINAVPWKALVQEISKANALDTEQVVSLEQETMLIIYGFENPQDYITNLIREVGIDETKAINIADSVWKKIMGPINQKVSIEKDEKTPIVSASVPEIPPTNLPVLEPDFAKETLATKPGETARDVAHVEFDKDDKVNKLNKEEEKPTAQPVESLQKEIPIKPDYRYPDGKDPYREPLK